MNQSLRPEAGQAEEGRMTSSSWGKVLGAAVGVWGRVLQGRLGGTEEEGL